AAFGACEAARSGITTLADVTDSGASMDAMLAVGLRGIVFQEVLGPNPIQAESIIENLIRKLRKLSGVETSLVSIGISPHSPYTVST
ncbi:MAG: hypothetical protein JNN15_17025, partial [Blastocatellia bacterium]|nr:hypothetical protein [Blastocatellia bacterium]